MTTTQAVSYLFSDSRARVYLVWAILMGIGFTVTHYFQMKTVNGMWFVISVIGLIYMYHVMPMRLKQMRNIFLSWLIPIVFGMVVSGLAFYISALERYTPDLGIFWLVVMAVGYLANGLSDSEPSTWYWVAFVLNIGAAVACLALDDFRNVQYLIAAIVSVWSMTNLWLLRSFDS